MLIEHGQYVLSSIVLCFFKLEKQIYEKRTSGFFFLSLFKLYKHEKDRVIIVFKLVKTSNSDKLVHHDKTEFHLH